MNHNYKVTTNKGLIDINTLSPNKLFFYKIRSAKELNKSAFGCPIAFFTITNDLIYFRKNSFAHELHSIKERKYLRELLNNNDEKLHSTSTTIKLVNWSKQGNVCYFLEYFENEGIKVYESVFLDCKNNCVYRIDEMANEGKFVNEFDVVETAFDENILLQGLKSNGIDNENTFHDTISFGLKTLFNKWYP